MFRFCKLSLAHLPGQGLVEPPLFPWLGEEEEDTFPCEPQAQSMRNLAPVLDRIGSYLEDMATAVATPAMQTLGRQDVAAALGASPACPGPPLGFHWPPTTVLVLSQTEDVTGIYDLMPRASQGRWWAQRRHEDAGWYLTLQDQTYVVNGRGGPFLLTPLPSPSEAIPPGHHVAVAYTHLKLPTNLPVVLSAAVVSAQYIQ